MTDPRAALLVAAILCTAPGATAAGTARSQLGADMLLGNESLAQPVQMAAFTPPANAQGSRHRFEGLLEFTPAATATGTRVLRDDFEYAGNAAQRVAELPPFRFGFIQVDDQLLPARRGPVAGDHPHWEWLLEPGRVWQEPGDGDYGRVALPFSLVQRGENCTHNGVMSFLFKSDGSVSRVAFEIASETCLYFQFDLWGLASARYLPQPLADGPALVRAHVRQLAARLPTRPIAALAQDWPGADPARFSGDGVIAPQHMSVYGFVIDGINYIGGCQTRQGPYPFCQELTLPSYSLAKSLLAGLGLMRLEHLYPGAARAAVADHVPACGAAGTWQDTSLENALDMATGNFTSAHYDDDETSLAMQTDFFEPTTHAAKIAFACQQYPRRVRPGSQWVYHTSDTYVLGAAMDAYLAQQTDAGADLFDDILLPWWQPLELSPGSRVARRSYDGAAQLFTGYGLFLQVDDIARLALFISSDAIRAQVDAALLDGALQRNPRDPGLPAMDGDFLYNNGFWAYPGYTSANCPQPLNLPFMLGYGGINVVLLPNDTVYYYFSDGGRFGWLAAAREADRIKPFCTSHTGTAQ